MNWQKYSVSKFFDKYTSDTFGIVDKSGNKNRELWTLAAVSRTSTCKIVMLFTKYEFPLHAYSDQLGDTYTLIKVTKFILLSWSQSTRVCKKCLHDFHFLFPGGT